MKAFFTLLISCCFVADFSAQSSLRIFTLQMQDITSLSDSVSGSAMSSVQAYLNVENIDTASHHVRAGRVEIVVDPLSANAITWALINHPPSADSSAVTVNMAPQQTEQFVGDYFANGTTSEAIIQYCFWDAQNVLDYSCTTIHFFPQLTSVEDDVRENFSVQPNISQGIFNLRTINIPGENFSLCVYSSTGNKILNRNFSGNEFRIDLSEQSNGLYFVTLQSESGPVILQKIFLTK